GSGPAPGVPPQRVPVLRSEARARRDPLARSQGLAGGMAGARPPAHSEPVRRGLISTIVGDVTAVLQSVVNEMAPGVVDSLDVQEIVDRVDIQSIVDQVDIQSIIDQVDLQSVVERLDLDALLKQ